MTPPAPTRAAARPVPTPPPGTTPAPPLDTPRPNPGEVVTLSGTAATTTWTLYSSKTEHRITRREKDGPEEQTTEYPSDSWAAAARYLVAALEASLVMAGSTTRGSVYCGDCANPVHKGACPAHGVIG